MLFLTKAVETAIRSGLNYVDTAPFYGEGRSEVVLGKALRRVPRDAYYIGTKVHDGLILLNGNRKFFNFTCSVFSAVFCSFSYSVNIEGASAKT